MQKDTETPEVRTEENYTDEGVCKKQMKVLTTTMPFVVEEEKKKNREIVSSGNLYVYWENS